MVVVVVSSRISLVFATRFVVLASSLLTAQKVSLVTDGRSFQMTSYP